MGSSAASAAACAMQLMNYSIKIDRRSGTALLCRFRRESKCRSSSL